MSASISTSSGLWRWTSLTLANTRTQDMMLVQFQGPSRAGTRLAASENPPLNNSGSQNFENLEIFEQKIRRKTKRDARRRLA